MGEEFRLGVEEWRNRVTKGRRAFDSHFSEPKAAAEDEQGLLLPPLGHTPVETHARASDTMTNKESGIREAQQGIVPYKAIYEEMTSGIGLPEDVEAFRWAVSAVGEHICSETVELELRCVRIEKAGGPEADYRAAVSRLVEYMLETRRKWQERKNLTVDVGETHAHAPEGEVVEELEEA